MSKPTNRPQGAPGPGPTPGLLLLSACLLATLPLLVWSCQDNEQTTGDASLTDAPADRIDTPDAGPDALPDASPDGGMLVIQHDYCDQPIFRLPRRGTASNFTAGTSGSHGHWLALAEPIKHEDTYPAYVFDLDTCREYHPLPDMVYWSFSVFGDALVMSAARGNNTLPEAYLLDFSTWKLTQLTDDPDLSPHMVAFNGRAIAYGLDDWTQPNGPVDAGYFMMDIETRDTTMLAPPGSSVGAAFMSPRYLAWTGFAPSVYKDVFYYDFATGEKVHVQDSASAWQHMVVVWDDYLLWDESNDDIDPPYRLVLYRISTGQKTLLTTENILIGFSMDKGLVVYNTGRYDPAHASVYYEDIEIYEIATGLSRRLTTKPSSAGVGYISLNWPYMGFSTLLPVDDDTPPSIFMTNLILLGVTDDQGNLIPGDPVIEPPGP